VGSKKATGEAAPTREKVNKKFNKKGLTLDVWHIIKLQLVTASNHVGNAAV
jgi:hypothetical protein